MSPNLLMNIFQHFRRRSRSRDRYDRGGGDRRGGVGADRSPDRRGADRSPDRPQVASTTSLESKMPRRRFTEGSPVSATAPPVKLEENEESPEKGEVLPDSTDDVTLPVKEEDVKKEDDKDGSAEKKKVDKKDDARLVLGNNCASQLTDI